MRTNSWTTVSPIVGMREPLFGLELPATVLDHYDSGEYKRLRLMIVTWQLDSPLTLLGDFDERQLQRLRKVRNSIVEQTAIAVVINENDPASWGSQNSNVIIDQIAAQQNLLRAQGEVNQTFKSVRRTLWAARQRCLPESTAAIRDLLILGRSQKIPNFFKLIDRIERAAREFQVKLDDYPLSSDAVRLLGWLALNERSARRQTRVFIDRLQASLSSWYKVVDDDLRVDLEKSTPYLQYWLDRTGISVDDLKEAVEGGHLEQVLSSCVWWYQTTLTTWFTDEVLRARPGVFGFFEEMMRLSLLAGIPYFDLDDFRASVAYERLAAGIPFARLWKELVSLSEDMVDALRSPDASLLLDVERVLDNFERAVTVRAVAAEVEVADLSQGVLSRYASSLSQLAGGDRRTLIQKCSALERLVPDVLSYLCCTERRGQEMVDRVLDRMHGDNEEAAVLEVSSLHLNSLRRRLEDVSSVSWCVLSL